MKRLWLGLMAVAVAAVAFATSTTTTNFTLTKPGVGDTGWGAAVNSNFDSIDKVGATLDTNGLIRSAVVKSSHVATNGIAGSNLQADCVKSSHVVDGSISGSDLGANVIKSSHIVAGEIQGVNLGSAIVKSSHVFTNGLSGSNFESNSVVSSMVVNGTLIADDLGTNRVAGSNLEAGCTSSSHVVVLASTVSYAGGANDESAAAELQYVATDGSTKTASALGAATDDIVTLTVPTGTTKVLVSMGVQLTLGGATYCRALLYVDGILDANMRILCSVPYRTPCSLVGLVTVTANATHTFEMRYQTRQPSGTMRIENRRLQVWAVGN